MKKWQIFLGILLIVMGSFTIIRLVFEVDLWKFVFPLLLISLGVFVILRPKMVDREMPVMMKLFGDIRRSGDRIIQNEEYWLLAGEVALSYGSSSIPEGETVVKIFMGVGEIALAVPVEVGVRIECESAICEIHSDFGKEDSFFKRNVFETPDYELKNQNMVFRTTGIVNEIKFKQISNS